MEVVDKNKVYKCAPYVQATGFTQLMLCVLNNDLKNASSYIFEIDVKNSEGWTALHISCRNSATFSSEEMVEFLLKNGADPNASSSVGWTPLHLASAHSNSDSSLKTVDALLRSGADSNAKNNYGWTPLHTASSSYSNDTRTISIATVDLLLRKGADPNAKDDKGWTPLHFLLSYSGDLLAIVELLLRSGADPNAKTDRDSTPLYFASQYSTYVLFPEIVDLLFRYGATPIDKRTQILKLEVDIESLVEENEKLQQKILLLENEV